MLRVSLSGLRRLVPRGLISLVALVLVSIAGPARAQTTITISMTAAPPAPKIQGAAVVATLTGAPFLHTVAVTGTPRPTFSATGLPTGLMLDAATGRISGTVATAGSIPITITASNSAGSDTRMLTIVAGAQLALTPPMGWNSYDSYDDSIREPEVLANAQAIQSVLQPLGWDTVVVDFRWYDPNTPQSDQNGSNPNLTLDGSGRLLPAPGRFPSATGSLGFGPLADMVHAMGLKFGIHLMRGIPRLAVTANAPIANSTFRAADAADMTSTCPWNSDMYGVLNNAAGQAWWDSIITQYASWGVDFLKVDDMVRNVGGTLYHQSEVAQVHTAILNARRSIVLSLSPGETPTSASVHLQGNANMWRMSNDFWDRPADLDHSFVLAASWQTVLGPGHWPDADMLPLGNLSPRSPVEANLRTNNNTRFTHNEQVMMMTLWTILPSPLMLGSNVTMIAGDAWTRALLTNDEVLAVNQDGMGARGTRIAQVGTTEVWARNLSEGRKAVALFNRGTADASVSATFAQLGVTGTPLIRDLWRRADVTGMTTALTVSVPARAGLLYTLSPASSGTGGAGGGPGGSGGVGAGGRAGSTGGSGGGSVGGATGSGGAGASGGAGDGPRGGTAGMVVVATGGAGGTAIGTGGSSAASGGTNGANGGASGRGVGGVTTPSSGCACGVGEMTANAARGLAANARLALALAVALALASGRRRRK